MVHTRIYSTLQPGLAQAQTKEEAEENTAVEAPPMSPEGVRKGTLEYWKRKCANLTAFNERVANIPFTPKEAGVLKIAPSTCQENDSARCKLNNDEFGSCKMKDMVGTKRKKREEAEAERERIDGKKQARVERLEQEAQEARQLAEAFERCQGGCVCGETPCPMAKMKKCAVCGDIKKKVCAKRACREAQQPLALPAPPVVASADTPQVVQTPMEVEETFRVRVTRSGTGGPWRVTPR